MKLEVEYYDKNERSRTTRLDVPDQWDFYMQDRIKNLLAIKLNRVKGGLSSIKTFKRINATT